MYEESYTFGGCNRLRRKSLNLERLRAAFEASGDASWHRLAAQAGITHPTLSRLLNGRVKAVNGATLQRLARALRVVPEWLTGERQDLPFMPQWGPLASVGAPSLWEKPTAAGVRDSWLLQRVYAAVQRDLDEWFGAQAQEAYDSWGHGLLAVILELSSSVGWRFAALESSGGNALLEGSDDMPVIGWVEHVLEPWLEGRSYLNAEVLQGIFEVLRRNPARLWGSEIRDSDGIRALEQYGIACGKAVSRRLAVLGPPEDD